MEGEVDLTKFAMSLVTLVLLVSAPPIIVASVVGIFVSLLQAVTQIQEQTFSFAVKIFTVILTIFLTSSWLGAEIYNFTILIMSVISRI